MRGESFSILNADACYTAQNKELVNHSLKVGILDCRHFLFQNVQ